MLHYLHHQITIKTKPMNSKREEIQSKGTEEIKNNDYNGIVLVSPRVGKSKMVLNALEGAKAEIYISSPYDSIRKNWVAEHKKWNSTVKLKSICHRSLQGIPQNLPILVIDEIHTLSDFQISTILLKNPQRILALTGFMSAETSNKLFFNFGLSVIFSYSIAQAIADKIISDFDVSVIKIPMDDTKRYIKIKQYYLTERNAYEYYTETFNSLKEKSIEKPELEKIKMVFSRKRKELIYGSNTKVNYANHLLDDSLKDSRIITFCGTTKVADVINQHLSHHSKNVKEDNLEKFISGEIDKLAVCQMVNMGITIENLKIAVVQQAQSNSEMNIQRILRVCNLEQFEKKAHTFVLCYENTVEEGWVESSLEGISKEKIKMYKGEDFNSMNQRVKEIILED